MTDGCDVSERMTTPTVVETTDGVDEHDTINTTAVVIIRLTMKIEDAMDMGRGHGSGYRS